MNQPGKMASCFNRGIILSMFFFSIGVSEDSQTRIIKNDSISMFMKSFDKYSFNPKHPIYRIYEISKGIYKDYIFLAENPYDTTGCSVLNDSVQAFCIEIKNEKCLKKWSLNDFIIVNTNNDVKESTIWFWTKYIQIKDIDRDEKTDYIIVYGTKGLNGIDDGRLKILIYHKDRKFAIRHQNGVLDFERQTQVDSSFYSLPESIQESVIFLIESIIQDGHAIFATDWKKSFENKRLLIKEEHQDLPSKK